MNNGQLDEAIVNASGEHWVKVAMIIARVEESLQFSATERESGLGAIAERIEELTRTGVLLARGDLKQWRSCEVRRPSATDK